MDIDGKTPMFRCRLTYYSLPFVHPLHDYGSDQELSDVGRFNIDYITMPTHYHRQHDLR